MPATYEQHIKNVDLERSIGGRDPESVPGEEEVKVSMSLEVEDEESVKPTRSLEEVIKQAKLELGREAESPTEQPLEPKVEVVDDTPKLTRKQKKKLSLEAKGIVSEPKDKLEVMKTPPK